MQITNIFLVMSALFLWAAAKGDPIVSESGEWTNRPQVIRVAERLAEEVELFDESLHAVEAPKAVIERTHHFEETVADFASELKVISYVEATEELSHIREDVEMIRREMYKYPKLMKQVKVSIAFHRMRLTYRELDHEMYVDVPGPGPGPGPTALSLNGAEYQVLGQGDLKSTATSVTGTGVVVFKNALKQDDNNFDLRFSLEDAGALTLIGSADAQLKGGAEISFAREGKALKVKLSAGGQVDDLSEEFTQYNAEGELHISVDIHEHGHLIVWVGEGEEQEYSFTAKLAGLQWGLSLNKASVTGAKDDKAKEEHGEEHEH